MKPSDQNPFSVSSESIENPPRPGMDSGSIVLVVILVLLTVPAMIIAFFVTCLASLFATTNLDLSMQAFWVISLISGGLGAVSVLALTTFYIVRIVNRSRKISRDRAAYESNASEQGAATKLKE